MPASSWGEEQAKSAAQRKATVLIGCSYQRHSDHRQLLFYLQANTPGFHLYTWNIPVNHLSPQNLDSLTFFCGVSFELDYFLKSSYTSYTFFNLAKLSRKEHLIKEDKVSCERVKSTTSWNNVKNKAACRVVWLCFSCSGDSKQVCTFCVLSCSIVKTISDKQSVYPGLRLTFHHCRVF